VSRVANRYSKALFRVALEQNKIDVVIEDLQMIQSLAEQNKDLKNLMQNPLIPTKKRISLIAALFEGKVDQLTFDFLNLICGKKRTAFLNEIAEKFAAHVQMHKGITPGVIRSAKKLSSGQREQIEKKVESLTGKKILFSEEIDQSLIGGFIVKVRDTVIDLSVKGQLEKLRHKLVHG
jgi:F-type H+-transporting ATPase subunit delta